MLPLNSYYESFRTGLQADRDSCPYLDRDAVRLFVHTGAINPLTAETLRAAQSHAALAHQR